MQNFIRLSDLSFRDELQIFNIVDCRAGFSKPFFHEIASNHNKLHVEDSFNNWDMLIKNSPKTRRRFRFQVERHWSYHYDPIKNKIISCDDNKVLVNNCPPFSTYSSSVFLKEETTILKQEEEEEEEEGARRVQGVRSYLEIARELD